MSDTTTEFNQLDKETHLTIKSYAFNDGIPVFNTNILNLIRVNVPIDNTLRSFENKQNNSIVYY